MVTKLSYLASVIAGAVSAPLARLVYGRTSRGSPPVGPVASAHKLHGVEIFPGVGTPISRTTRYGATFVGVQRGRASVILVGWVNYAPIFFKPSTECTIVGGRWWLVSVEGARCRGMLHGSFDEGVVQWNKNAKIAVASVRLKVLGGTEAYRESLRGGTFTAGLNHRPFPPLPPKIGGTLRLER